MLPDNPKIIMRKATFSKEALPRGRITVDTSNADEINPPESEDFPELTPRGPLPPSISVLGIDMLANENKKVHNTSKYKETNLIVRRNKEFFIVIKFDQPFKKTLGSWLGRVVESRGNMAVVGITPNAKCIIGRFRTFVVVVTDYGKQRTPRNTDTDFYVLFNPWDPADQVYMPNETDRQEYVMNDVGIIYNGEFKNITTRTWNFGQFEQGMLDACLMVLDFGKVPILYRGNATEVARQGSALINSLDDKGVLVGNWTGDYSIGTAPTAWTGSPEILLKYAKNGGVPVCFAQCWVFAGVLNTFMRCLGVPTRVVTNYCSAHDNTGNLKTDIMLDEDGRVDRSKTRDSVWNYHCWNEVFMKRPDLPDKYSGWQVIDCTPQETSDGLFRCGPTSVNAIREGELSYPFDARFVFAEVRDLEMLLEVFHFSGHDDLTSLLCPQLNSDVIYHQCDKYGNSKTIYVDPAYVGKLIITKRPNSQTYDNITTNYKYAEGSDQDKQTMSNAENRGVPPRELPTGDSGVDIELQADTVQMGEDFTLTLNITNQSSKPSTVNATVSGCIVYYTGVTSKIFKMDKYTSAVEPRGTAKVKINIQAKDYMANLVEQSNLLFVVFGQVQETGAAISKMRVVTLKPPELTIKVSGVPRVGRDLAVTMSFRNPYSFILKNIQLRLDGPGLTLTKIAPGGTLQYTDTIIPQAPGKKVLIGCLDCPALRQVTNHLEIIVQP
ncbi:hypothetical protein DNTS_018077 [Danionella cerebrum]|uniref:Transglutaminase-like domain-containing protein n=2 Tax=Danionella cerebrum TaxID=2873325 RepID=A0A553QGV5_9TELE|nr:hypothetical protein DNTS_018077 [Danionella translucida]